MDKNKGIPKGIGKGLPTIGEKQIPIQEIVSQIAAQLKPTMDIILSNIDALEQRLNVAEEVRQIFPDKVDVTINHKYPNVSIPHTVTEAEMEAEIFDVYKKIIAKKEKK